MTVWVSWRLRLRVRVKRKVRAMVWVKDRGKVWVDIRRRKDVRVCVWIMIEEMKKAKKERDEQCRWLLRTWTSDKFIIYFYHNKNKVYYYPSLSYPILSYRILSSSLLSYSILSSPILSYPILSHQRNILQQRKSMFLWIESYYKLWSIRFTVHQT